MRIQMNYTFILKNKTWNIHRKFRGYLFILGKNKKWKNNFRECSAKLYGNFTQHPGPLFWFRVCWDLIAVEQAEFSRKAPMLGYLLIFYILAKRAECSIFVKKPFSLMHIWLKTRPKQTYNLHRRKALSSSLIRIYLFLF